MLVTDLPHPTRALIRAALLSVILLGICGCAYAVTANGHVDRARVERLAVKIQKIRQLKLKRPVPIVMRTPGQVGRMLMAKLSRVYSDQQLQVDGTAGAMLGLYPSGVELKAETVKLMKTQVAALYDPRRNEMILINGSLKPGFFARAEQFLMHRDIARDMILAHEFTHALQNQNFALEKKLESFRHDGDRALALKSVAEGDATLAGFACVAGRMDDSIADTLTNSMATLPQLFAARTKGTPVGLSEPLIFQYSSGERFVADAYRKGGWKAVDELYAKPPESTQQIMHPALYFQNFTPPVSVAISGYRSLLSSGWKEIDNDTYGELLLKIILERGFGSRAPEVTIAKEWAGDRIVVLGRRHQVTAIWMVVFRNRESAERFATLYSILLDRTLGTSTSHHVQSHSDAVLVVVGQGARDFKSLTRSIWKSTSIAKPKPLPLTEMHARARTGTQAVSYVG